MLQGGNCNCLIYFDVSFGKGVREETGQRSRPQVSLIAYIFNTRNQTHALSLHTQGEVFRLENSAASSTTPTVRLGRISLITWQYFLSRVF